MEVHKGKGDPAHVDACEQGEEVKNPDFCVDVINRWHFIPSHFPLFLFNFPHILQVPPIIQMVLCSYTKFSSPCQNVTFPSPILTKPFVSPLNGKLPQ